MTLEENINKLAAQPLLAQPGSAWNYSLSIDVLGRIVEVVSGMSLDAFLRDRIFTPLGMTDTSFEVADAKWARMATVYSPDGAGRHPADEGPRVVRQHRTCRRSAYYKARQALLLRRRRPHIDRTRLRPVRADAAERRRARRRAPARPEDARADDGQPHDRSACRRADRPGRAGSASGSAWSPTSPPRRRRDRRALFGWSGIYGTMFWVDPKERLVAIMMVQRYPGSPVARASSRSSTKRSLGRKLELRS